MYFKLDNFAKKIFKCKLYSLSISMNQSLKSIAIVKVENDSIDPDSFMDFINTLNFYFTKIYLVDKMMRNKQRIRKRGASKIYKLYLNFDQAFVHFVTQPPVNLTCYSSYVLLSKVSTNIDSSYDDDKARNLRIYTNYLNISSNIINKEHLNLIIQQKLQFYSISQRICTVIVFDLDDTLIDVNDQPLVGNLQNFIENTRNIFDFVVLWSHGTCEHVHHNLKLHNLQSSFDLVISRNYKEQTKNKSIGLVFKELHKKFNIAQISMSALVDDLHSNFNEDYDYYLQVPRSNAKTVEKFYNFAFEKLQCLIFNNIRHRIISW